MLGEWQRAFERRSTADSATLRRAGRATLVLALLASPFLIALLVFIGSRGMPPEVNFVAFLWIGLTLFIVWTVGVHRVLWGAVTESPTIKLVASVVVAWGILMMLSAAAGLVAGLAMRFIAPTPATATAPAVLVRHDILSTDVTAAADFYKRLMPWTLTPDTVAPFGETRRAEAGGKLLGHFVSLPREEGIASHWLTYAGVVDLDRAIATAHSLGGYVPVPATPMGATRMAVIADQRGAHLGLIELVPGAAPPLQLVDVPRHELITDNAMASADFFASVLGWTVALDVDSGRTVRVLRGGDREIAVVVERAAFQPQWVPFFAVDNLEKSSAAAAAADGGRAHGARFVTGDGAQAALFADPTGATFGLVGAAPPPQQ